MLENIKVLIHTFSCHTLCLDLVKKHLILMNTLSSCCDLKSLKQ